MSCRKERAARHAEESTSEDEEEDESSDDVLQSGMPALHHHGGVQNAAAAAPTPRPPVVAPGYRDYSNHRRPSLYSSSTMLAAGFQNFPMKLHEILSKPEYSLIASWLPHGRSFIIHNTKEFEDVVLPRYFRHGRYASFARQLNGWGFRRIASGSDHNSYYHEMFLRGLPHLCHLMRRHSSKEIKAMKSEPRTLPVPDLHAISRDYPLPEAYGGVRVSSATGTQSSSSSGTTPPIVGTGGLAPLQGQAPPGMGTLLQHTSAGTGTTAALASIMIQAAGHPAPPPPPQAPLAAALPTGNVADLLLSLLNQQTSAPAQAPAAASIPAPSAALPPEQQLMATLLAQQQANNNNNNARPSVAASASGFTPVSGAVGGMDLSALSSVPQAVSNNQGFMFNPNPTLAWNNANNAVILPQFSQQLGGIDGGNNSSTEAALLLTIRSLASSAPVAPPPPPPPPPQPSSFNIQELLRLLGNSNPGNSNNKNHSSDQGGGNQER